MLLSIIPCINNNKTSFNYSFTKFCIYESIQMALQTDKTSNIKRFGLQYSEYKTDTCKPFG